MIRLTEIPLHQGNDNLWEALFELIGKRSRKVKDPDVFRETMKAWYRMFHRREYLIIYEDQAVGMWQYDTVNKGLPTEEGQIDFWLIEGEKPPGFWPFFAESLAQQMKEQNHQRVIFYTSDPQVRKGVETLGVTAVNTLDFFELSRLQVDEARLGEWERQFAPEQYGFTAELQETLSEETIQSMAELETLCANGMMRQDYSWKTVKTPQFLREHQALDHLLDNRTLNCLIRNEVGEIVAFSKMVRESKSREKAKQRLTGVHPDFRGKGLGKWLKAKMIRELFRRFPEVKKVQTGSLVGNLPMRRINEQVGYQANGDQEWEFILPLNILMLNAGAN